MPKNIFIIIPIIIIIIGFAIYRLFFYSPELKKNIFKIKDHEYHLEIATTLAQKEQGLMNRSNLCQNCGMIFVSGFEMPQIFWMKNTLIPLDMIFLDKNGQVINIVNATPEPNTPDSKLRLYKSDRSSKYVIELNSGDSKKLGLIAGDCIDLSGL